MRRIAEAIDHLHMMDMEARQKGILQDLDSLSKLLVTIIFITLTVSFPRYDLGGVLLMGLYPITMILLGEIPLRPMMRRMGILMILVSLIGAFNPFFDRAPVFRVLSLTVTGGMLSMLSLVVKGIYALLGGYILMVTTSMDDISRALKRIHVPSVIVMVITMTYRYIIVFLEEADRVSDAYALRAPQQRGIDLKAWGPLVGQILLRSMERAEMVYASMLARGYQGACYQSKTKSIQPQDCLFTLVWTLVLTLIRIVC